MLLSGDTMLFCLGYLGILPFFGWGYLGIPGDTWGYLGIPGGTYLVSPEDYEIRPRDSNRADNPKQTSLNFCYTLQI